MRCRGFLAVALGLIAASTLFNGSRAWAQSDTAACQRLLDTAGAALDAGNPALAEQTYNDALTTFTRADDVADCLIKTYGKLAGLYAVQGRLSDEAEIMEARLRLREAQLGVNHPDLMFEAHDLAGLYMELQRHADAARYMEQVLVFDIETFGATSVPVGDSHLFIAFLWEDAGEGDKADFYYDRALDIYDANLPPDHPDVVRVLRRYEALLRDLDRPVDADALAARISPLTPN